MLIEQIPENDHLYRRVHHKCYDPISGKCTEGAFLLKLDRQEQYLSVDWAERTTLEVSCLDPNTKKKFKIAEIRAGYPRELGLTVEHKPSLKHIAHAGILGKALHDDVQRIIIASQLAEKSIVRSS